MPIPNKKSQSSFINLRKDTASLQQSLHNRREALECVFTSLHWGANDAVVMPSDSEFEERLSFATSMLPKLTKISFSLDFDERTHPVSIRAIAKVLSMRSDTLQSFAFPDISRMIGTREEFDYFFTSLGHCIALKELSIDWDCEFEVTGTHHTRDSLANQWVADGILSALNNIESLEEVTFEGVLTCSTQVLGQLCQRRETTERKLIVSIEDHPPSAPALEAICGPNSRVTELTLTDMEMHHASCISDISACLGRNQTLRKLCLADCDSLDAAVTLLEGLANNKTLQEVKLEFDCGVGETKRCGDRLALAIEKTPLKKLDMGLWDADNTGKLGSIGCIIGGLSENRSIEELRIGLRNHISTGSPIQDFFHQLYSKELKQLEVSLKENAVLKEFEVELATPGATPWVPLPLSDQTRSLLELNRAGREKTFG